MSVKLWDMCFDVGIDCRCCMEQRKTGYYVTHDDYTKLETYCIDLAKQRDECDNTAAKYKDALLLILNNMRHGWDDDDVETIIRKALEGR